MPQPALTLITGPTASGKSRLALELARETGAVIINADSQQLYADLRVLTARPSPEDEAQADHRLYGVADAADAWSVGRWSRAVLAMLEERDGGPAVLVGGTGLYFIALIRGLADIPDVPVELRDALIADWNAKGEEGQRRRLASLDPAAEARIGPGDRQRIVRALGVALHTNRPLTAWTADTRPLLAPGSWTGLVIEPPRDLLYANCDSRAESMIREGALEEVRALTARGLAPALPAMKAVGVRELAAWQAGEISRHEALESLKQATRRYAKRQLTWFRNQTPDWPRRVDVP